MQELARRTFDRSIASNRYPGRGLVIGRNTSGSQTSGSQTSGSQTSGNQTSGGPGQGDWTLVYWIMGRSENSRNRQFIAEGGVLRTQAFDPQLVVDPSLIIYEAMLELPGIALVSNGDQTRTLCDALARGGSFEAALAGRAHEPDAPHYTPRISGMLDLRSGSARLSVSILRANPHDPALTDRTLFQLAAPPPGIGRAITTYAGDGNPLPSFTGEPLVLPLEGRGSDILEAYWRALDADNRISLAVKTLAPDGSCRELLVKNRHS